MEGEEKRAENSKSLLENANKHTINSFHTSYCLFVSISYMETQGTQDYKTAPAVSTMEATVQLADELGPSTRAQTEHADIMVVRILVVLIAII